MDAVLEMENLVVSFATADGTVEAVRGVSLSVNEGETVALVGESGCGKSATAQAILRLHAGRSVNMDADVLQVTGRDVLNADSRELGDIRAKAAGMIFQDPLSSLNPTMKVGKQITETLRRKQGWSASACAEEAVRLLEMVHIDDAALRAKQYPFQLSGGMRQRAMLAMAMAGSPRLLIADEPTTALDATTQLEVLKLLGQLQCETSMALLIITHDLGVVANLAQRVAVMYAGRIVETAAVDDIFNRPAHPYTRGLLESLPSAGEAGTLHAIPGSPPSLLNPPEGCPFAPRCSHCMQVCIESEPPLLSAGLTQFAACWMLHSDYPGERRSDGNPS